MLRVSFLSRGAWLTFVASQIGKYRWNSARSVNRLSAGLYISLMRMTFLCDLLFPWRTEWFSEHASTAAIVLLRWVFLLCAQGSPGLLFVCLFVFRRLDISFWNYPEISSCLLAVCQNASVKSEGGLLPPCKSLGGVPCLLFLLLLNLSTHGNTHILNMLKISQAMQEDYDSCWWTLMEKGWIRTLWVGYPGISVKFLYQLDAG